MNVIEDIKRLAADDNVVVSRQWLDEAMKEAPYLGVPLLLYLKRNGINDEKLLARLAIMSPDRKVLAMQLGRDVDKFSQFYPAEQPIETPATDTAIEKFLDTYGKTGEREMEVLQQIIFNPQPDYAEVLAAQERDSAAGTHTADEQDVMIDNFIADAEKQERNVGDVTVRAHADSDEVAEVADTPIDNPDEQPLSTLSEGLARMYISRGNYSRALEIIEALNLNYPEKSIYFATQIRFLKKLILNRQHLNINK